MVKAIFGTKLGMTQVFDASGDVVPVSVVKAEPCVITQLKSKDKDGYDAVQIGYGQVKERKLTSPQKGHFQKAGVRATRYLAEIRVEELNGYELGQEIKVSVLEEGDSVKVTGVSRGKGFTGVVKRHGFRGGPGTHGSMFHRAPGSIGASSFPSKVDKGKRFPGRMGGERVTARGLKVMRVDQEKNLILLKGSVPGPKGGWVLIQEDRKKK
jgi:large subunit ribosomal protein L3